MEVQVSGNLKSSRREGASRLACQDLDGPRVGSWCVVAAIGLPGKCTWTTVTVVYLGPHALCAAWSCAESVSHAVVGFAFILPHAGGQDVTVFMLLFLLCPALAWLLSSHLFLT